MVISKIQINPKIFALGYIQNTDISSNISKSMDISNYGYGRIYPNQWIYLGYFKKRYIQTKIDIFRYIFLQKQIYLIRIYLKNNISKLNKSFLDISFCRYIYFWVYHFKDIYVYRYIFMEYNLFKPYTFQFGYNVFSFQ